MSTAALITVSDYLLRTEKPNCEYVDGVLQAKAMPTTLHSFIQGVLLLLLNNQGVQALPELTVRLSATKYLVPDLTVVGRLELPYPTEPALLCIEILSSEDRVGATLDKCEQYHAWGVPVCWVIDPERQSAWEYRAGEEPSSMDQRAACIHSEVRGSPAPHHWLSRWRQG